MNPWLKKQTQKIGRASLVGGLATACSIGALTVMIQVFGLTTSQANAPSLASGMLIQFLGNRYFVFKASEATLGPQILLYALEEAIAFGLNLLAFELLTQHTSLHYTLARMVGTFVVFAGFSYPTWHWVFKNRTAQPKSPPQSS